MVAPKDGVTTKEKNGKHYHWCAKHKMWTLHKPEEFKLENKPGVNQEQGAATARSLDCGDG